MKIKTFEEFKAESVNEGKKPRKGSGWKLTKGERIMAERTFQTRGYESEREWKSMDTFADEITIEKGQIGEVIVAAVGDSTKVKWDDGKITIEEYEEQNAKEQWRNITSLDYRDYGTKAGEKIRKYYEKAKSMLIAKGVGHSPGGSKGYAGFALNLAPYERYSFTYKDGEIYLQQFDGKNDVIRTIDINSVRELEEFIRDNADERYLS